MPRPGQSRRAAGVVVSTIGMAVVSTWLVLMSCVWVSQPVAPAPLCARSDGTPSTAGSTSPDSTRTGSNAPGSMTPASVAPSLSVRPLPPHWIELSTGEATWAEWLGSDDRTVEFIDRHGIRRRIPRSWLDQLRWPDGEQLVCHEPFGSPNQRDPAESMAQGTPSTKNRSTTAMDGPLLKPTVMPLRGDGAWTTADPPRQFDWNREADWHPAPPAGRAAVWVWFPPGTPRSDTPERLTGSDRGIQLVWQLSSGRAWYWFVEANGRVRTDACPLARLRYRQLPSRLAGWQPIQLVWNSQAWDVLIGPALVERWEPRQLEGESAPGPAIDGDRLDVLGVTISAPSSGPAPHRPGSLPPLEPVLDELTVFRTDLLASPGAIRSPSRIPSSGPSVRTTWSAAASPDRRAQDEVTLANGDILFGQVVRSDRTQLWLQGTRSLLRLAWTDVSAVAWATTPAASSRSGRTDRVPLAWWAAGEPFVDRRQTTVSRVRLCPPGWLAPVSPDGSHRPAGDGRDVFGPLPSGVAQPQ
jgi:hypothetical protein